jgi:predicted ATPase
MEPTVDALAARLEQRLRSGRTPGVASADTRPAADLDRLTASIEEVAALSGRFDPDALVSAVDPSSRVSVLSRLAASSVVEVQGARMRWLLKADRRTDVLKRLVTEQRLETKLSEPLPATDRFGEKLRELLRTGASVAVEGLSRDDLLATAAAIEATSGIDVPKPDDAAIRQSLAQFEFLSDYSVLLEGGFVGRVNELEDLRTFLADPPETSQVWTGLVLTGLGGAGKSTLLAKFARDCVTDKTATVVVLDFDRPGVEPNDTPWLEAEMTRQASCQYRGTEQALRSRRRDTRQKKQAFEEQFASFAAQRREYESSLRDLVSDLARVLTDAGAGDRPLLLVLDTFEEVMQRDLDARVLDWLNEIAERLWPIRLKVIFSGRLFDHSRDVLKGHGVTQTIEVEELEPAMAERLLLIRKVPPELAKRLAASDVLPRRPLELKLLARLVTETGAPTVEELEQDLRSGGDKARDLFAGLVYRRVLLRIKDQTTRTLAYPGLVLRYVTADLVRQVLAPVLELPEMDEAQATAALDGLAGYDWLAYRGPDGEVWHRKDLRRSILQAMIAQEPERARRIHEKAIEYFSDDTPRHRAEQIYHRLMLTRSPEDGGSFDREDLKRAYEHIGADIVDLPPPAAALLRFAASQDLSVADVALLPPRYVGAAYSDKGKLLVDDREFGTALKLYRDVHVAGKITAPIDRWEVETLYATATWNDPVPPPRPPLQRLKYAVFPEAVMGPGRVPRFHVEAELRSEDSVRSILGDRRASTTIERLAVGLVMLNGDDPFSASERDAVGAFQQRARSSTPAPGTASIEGWLSMLSALATPMDWRQLTVPLAPLWLPIDEASLDALEAGSQRQDSPDREAILALVSGVRRARTQSVAGRWTVRSLLGAVNGLNNRPGGTRMQVGPAGFDRTQTVKLWSTPIPAFRDPCRFALLEAFTDADGYRTLAGFVSSIIGLPLNDLVPDAFVAAVSADPEHTLEIYVEAIDRFTALGDILTKARAVRPDSPKLKDVEAAYLRWTRAVDALFRRD